MMKYLYLASLLVEICLLSLRTLPFCRCERSAAISLMVFPGSKVDIQDCFVPPQADLRRISRNDIMIIVDTRELMSNTCITDDGEKYRDHPVI